MPGETGTTGNRRTIRRGEEPEKASLARSSDGASATGLLMFAVLLVIAVLATVTLVWIGENEAKETSVETTETAG